MSAKLPDRVIFRVAQVLIENPFMKKEDLAAQINSELGLHGTENEISRQGIYELAGIALAKGMLRLVPPLDVTLKNRLVQKFNLTSERVHVVATTPENSQFV